MPSVTNTSKTAFRVAYDGSGYHGFQRQPDVETIEGTILAGLRELDLIEEQMTPPSGYAAAGRTDAGVSAIAQTVAFEAPEWVTPAVLNGAMPSDIRVWAAASAPIDFHATHDAVDRTYEYYLHTDGLTLDSAVLETALSRLAGTHDFHNLTLDDTGTERTIETGLTRDDPFFILTFRADGFPRQLIRRAVSLVKAIAMRGRPLSDVDRLLSGPPVNGPDGVAPANPHGLVLTEVSYPMLTFEIDSDAIEAVCLSFDDRRTRLETRAQILQRTLDTLAHEE